MSLKHISAWVGLVVALLAACGETSDPGSLDVSWRTGRLSCAEAGVDSVVVELHNFDSAEPAASATATCDRGAARVAEVAPGEYALLVRGLDRDGCWTHSARRDDVRVESGTERSVADLPLLRRTRPMLVRWPFANELDCTGNNVEQVLVRIFVDDTFSRDYSFLCPGLAVEINDIPRGDVRVEIVAYDDEGNYVGLGAVEHPKGVFEANPCADHVEVRVPIELEFCDSADCG